MMECSGLSKLYLFPMILPLLLVGCTTPKTPLSGKREDFIIIQDGLKLDGQLSKEVIQSKASQNLKTWKQVNQNASHTTACPFKLDKDVKLLWSEVIGLDNRHGQQNLITPPLVDQGVIYTIDGIGTVEARDHKTGQLRWSFATLPNTVSESAVVGGGMALDEQGILYVTTSFGDLVAFDTKKQKVKYTHSFKIPFRSCPTIADGIIFVINVNNELQALDSNTGEILWNHHALNEASFIFGGASPAYKNGVVVAVFSSGEIFAFQGRTGQLMWSDTLTNPTRVESSSSITHIKANPIIDDEVVYVISYGNRFVAYDVSTGNKLWEKDISGFNTPAIVGQCLFLVDTTGRLMAVDKKTGAIYWIKKVHDQCVDGKKSVQWFGPIAANNALILTNSLGKIVWYDSKDGQFIKEIDLQNQVFLPPIIVDETISVLCENATLWVGR